VIIRTTGSFLFCLLGLECAGCVGVVGGGGCELDS
jgi:hypothetical protein